LCRWRKQGPSTRRHWATRWGRDVKDMV
jgi:hypothetical protein